MGRDKSRLVVGGKPILSYLLERFSWAGPTMLVTGPGNEHPPGWELFGREVVDPVADLGPLRGLLTALEAAGTERVVVATVDMPGMGAGQLDWLLGRLGTRENRLGVMCLRCGVREPFPFACRVAAREVVAERLARGVRSVHSLAEVPGFAEEVAPGWEDGVWVNLNLPSDYEEFVRRAEE